MNINIIKKNILIKLILLFFLAISIISCNSENNESSLYSFDGKYISADKQYDSILVANRNSKQSWETFIISKYKENKYTIKTLENTYISVDYQKNNALFANSKRITQNCVFTIIFDKKYNNLVVKASNEKYVSIENDKIVRANANSEPLINTIFLEKSQNNIFNSYFTNIQLITLLISFSFILLSIYFFNFKNKLNYSLLYLFLGGIALRIFAILLDPYLNLWDERIHGLVAKNMLENPFKPMLYVNPAIKLIQETWVNNHIWLHKQPLFLWQIALSFKIFGVNEIALRIPSLIMSSLLILVIFRIAILITNKKIAFYAALLYTCSNYTLEFISGRGTTDHNDMAFAFYISLSIWAFIEFYFSNKKKWIILIGLFSGMAILNKWLTGLLIYSGWGIMLLTNKEYRFELKKYTELGISFIITCITVLPWQIYILYKFPMESIFEYKYNTKHFYEVIEGHSGDFMYHFNQTIDIYGVHFVIIILSILCFNKIVKNKDIKIALNTIVIITYLFFTIAATKMFSFTYAISTIIFISISALIFLVLETIIINKKILIKQVYNKAFRFLLIITISYFFLNLDEIQKKHTNYKREGFDYKSRIYTHLPIYKKLENNIPDKNYVIFNVPHFENISLMFYTHFTAYDFPLTFNIYNELKSKNIKIAVFDDGNLQDFIKNDKDVFIIK